MSKSVFIAVRTEFGWNVPSGALSPRERESMKVIVDFDVCQSHGLCMQAAPEIFEVREDGFLYILRETPPESYRAVVEKAIRECPTGAIRVED
jgi:ferredoxin